MHHSQQRLIHLSRLPWWISRWLGYRAQTPPKTPLWLTCFWSFIATFCGISIIQAVFTHARYFIQRGVPMIVPSFGSSAALIYAAIDLPSAQPLPLLGGHFIGAFVGVGITKLIHLVPTEERFLQLEWLAGSLSCAITVVLMQVTKTMHPPAAATTLLAAVNKDVRDLSWYFLPVILLTAALSLAVGLIINNIQCRYPLFWLKEDKPDLVGKDEMDSTRVNSTEDVSRIKAVERSPV